MLAELNKNVKLAIFYIRTIKRILLTYWLKTKHTIACDHLLLTTCRRGGDSILNLIKF
jgi:hypothetical protein